MMRVEEWAVIVSLAFLASCGSSSSSPPTTGGSGKLLDTCLENTDCASGVCQMIGNGYCSQSCEAGSCPQGLACGTGSDGKAECVRPCVTGMIGSACVNGLPVSCAVAPTDQCGVCGCPDNTTHCVQGTGCMPNLALGGACTEDDMCSDGYCARGTPSGSCSKLGCMSDSDCQSAAACVFSECVGSTLCSYCLPTCDADAGTCGVGTCRGMPRESASGGLVQVCDPRGDTGACGSGLQCLSNVCTSSACEPQMAIGQPCNVNTECISGACGTNVTANVCAESFGDPCTTNGDCILTAVCCMSGSPSVLNTCQAADRCN